MRKEVVVVVATAISASTLVVALALFRAWNKRKERKWKRIQSIISKFAKECATPVTKLWDIADGLVSKMEASRSASNGLPINTSFNMLVSYVHSLPSGNEKGFYYGVNLRPRDFLVLCARLGGNNEELISDLHRKEISIPSNVIDGTSQELFEFIAVELGNFVSAHPNNGENDVQTKQKNLGFIISYPVAQEAHPSGNAIKWENFSADDEVGKILVSEMNQALEKHGVDLHVSGIVDDAVGNLAGGKYYNNQSVAAITLGMGTNAAYVESVQAVSKWDGSSPNSEEMFCSSNPGYRIFEKLISGMYLGEIVRRVLVKLAQEAALFGKSVPKKLLTPFQLRSPDMAAMHQDTTEDHEVVGEKLKEVFGITNSTPMARKAVTEVCDIVAERGARLIGAGIVGIIKKLGRLQNKLSVVTIEGGLYEHYRVFRNYLHSSVWEMLGDQLSYNVIIEPSHGGTGTGALFLAALQNKINADIS